MECQRCGLSNAEAARFCPGCGNALSAAGGGMHTERPPGPGETMASVQHAAPQYPVPQHTQPPAPPRPTSQRVPPPYPPLRSPAAGLGSTAVPETFDLVQRPESMRPGAPEVAFAPQPRRPAASVVGPAHLAVISQDGSTGQTHWIEQGSVDIGREEGEIRLVADRFVSPRHARVFSRNGTFVLKDLGSLNGVYLRVRESEPLQHADLVLLGSEVLRFDVMSPADREMGVAVERGTEVYGSPARPRYACLSERTVEGVYRNVFYIFGDEIVIGREFGDLVFTTDSFMSRRHASIHRDPLAGTFTLRDLGSSNGTYLAIRGEVELREGDHLRVGQHLFRFGFGS
jgi:pSer/pThr/pTyr-binding forkhead associated (FHA) protein